MPAADSPDSRSFGDVGTKLLLDNEQVRVWEFELAPGQRSALHHHRHDYVMVQIAGDRIAAEFEPDSEGTYAGNDYLDGEVVAGAAIFARAGGKETAVNIGDETFKEVVIEVKSERRRGMLPIQHVSLMVDDFEAALPFYTETLGFDMLARPDFGIPGAWLSTGNGIQIHLIEQSGFKPPPGPHIAFETRDIDAEVSRLRDAGVEVGDPSEMDEFRQAFFHDPCGNQLELNQPTAR